MYEEWTNTVLKAYNEQIDDIKIYVNIFLGNEEYSNINEDDLESICKIWWISMCAVGHSGTLHPFEQELSKDTLIEISNAANVDINSLSPVILAVDNYIQECNSEKEEPDGMKLYIMPLLVAVTTIVEESEDLPIKLPNQDTFSLIAKMGYKAMGIGENAWTAAFRSSWNDAIKQSWGDM